MDKNPDIQPCELTENCPFFNEKIGALPGLVSILKKEYCLLMKTRCARYRVVQAVGRKFVPPDLFPNDAEQAEAIIAEARQTSSHT